MKWLLVAGLVACGGDHHGKPDAPVIVDGATDAAADAAIDAALDAPPDAPVAGPRCTTTPSILVDTSPRRITTMAVVGGVLYVAAYDPNNLADVVVLAVDPATGASVAPALVPGAVVAVWPAPDAAYAAEGRANGSIWRFVAGQTPVELVTGRNAPFVVTSDGTYVYWSEKNATQGEPEQIWRRLIAGGPIEHVMDGCANPYRIVVDSTDLYCLEFSNGDVLRAPKTGGTATGVPYSGATGGGYPAMTLVQEGSNLYLANFYNNPEIWGAAKPDGPLQLLTTSPDLGRYLGLALSATDFYVTNQEGYVERIDRTSHVVHKIEISDMATIGSPSLDPILWNGQLLVVADGWTVAGNRYVLHCVD